MSLIHNNLYVPPRADHWLFQNRRVWSADEVEEFLEEHCGKDVIRPCGTQLLILKPKAKEAVSKGGIILPHLAEESRLDVTSVGMVLDFGPDAYQDLKLFPSGPRCYRGDWVVYYKYERRLTNVKTTGETVQLLNCYDDKILNVIEKPEWVVDTPLA